MVAKDRGWAGKKESRIKGKGQQQQGGVSREERRKVREEKDKRGGEELGER